MSTIEDITEMAAAIRSNTKKDLNRAAEWDRVLVILKKILGMDKENTPGGPREDNAVLCEEADDSYLIIFHSLDLLLLLNYSTTSKDSASNSGSIAVVKLKSFIDEILFQTSFMSYLPNGLDDELSKSAARFDRLKGVRKGIFVLGQCLGILIAQMGFVGDGLNTNDPSLALYNISTALFKEDSLQDSDQQIVSKQLPIALDWLIDILSSKFSEYSCSDTQDSTLDFAFYPGANIIRSLSRDLLIRLVFHYEKFDVNVSLKLLRAFEMALTKHPQLIDSIWTCGQDRDLFIAFLQSMLLSDDPELGLLNSIRLLSTMASTAIGAVEVGEILTKFPLLSLPRTPDRHWVEESSQPELLLLCVKKQLRLSYGNVGIILPVGTTGIQNNNVLWTVEWSPFELFYRALGQSISSDIISLLANLSRNGFKLPAPVIQPFFEISRLEELDILFTVLLRKSIDEGCDAQLLNDLLTCLQFFPSKEVLYQLDILSDTPRGLYHALKFVDIRDREQRSVLCSFLSLISKFEVVSTDASAQAQKNANLELFLDTLLTNNPTFADFKLVVSALSSLHISNPILVKKFDLLNAFLKFSPDESCLAGACVLLENRNVHCRVDQALVGNLFSDLPTTANVIALLLDSITLSESNYKQIAKYGNIDAVLSKLTPAHLIQLKSLSLLDGLIASSKCVAFLFTCAKCVGLDRQLVLDKNFSLATSPDDTYRTLVDLFLISGIPFDYEAEIRRHPISVANSIICYKQGDLSLIKLVLQYGQQVRVPCVDLIRQIQPDSLIISNLLNLDNYMEVLTALPASDLFLELLDHLDASLLSEVCLKVTSSDKLLLALQTHSLLPMFFTRSNLSSAHLPGLLSKHSPVLSTELVQMGLLEALSPANPNYIPSILACTCQSTYNRILALLPHLPPIPSSPSHLQLLLTLCKLSKTTCNHLNPDVLLQTILDFVAADPNDCRDWRMCVLALCILEECGVEVPRKVLEALKGTPAEAFALLLL